MKRIMTTLAVMVMIITSAAAMSFSKARREAYFLTDKMAFELSLSTSQMDAVYEINLDYFLALNSPADLEGIYWMRRNTDLRYVLSLWQWDLYTHVLDFYRPMYWVSGNKFSLYVRNRYTRRNDFFYDRPTIYGSYRGGHNSGHASFYANRNYGAPVAPPAIPNTHGTQRSGNGQPGYSIGGGHQGNTNPGGNRQGSVNTGSSRGNSNPNNGRGTVTNEGRNTNVPSTTTGGRSSGGGSTQSNTSRGGSSSTTTSRSGSVGNGSSTTTSRSSSTGNGGSSSSTSRSSGSTSRSGSSRGGR